jgi:miniconductance mechanosensitive channel
VFAEEMDHQHLIRKMTHVIPPIVFLALIPFAFQTDSDTLHLIERIVLIYFVIMVGWSLSALCNVLWVSYDSKENTKNLPLKGILNLAKGSVWIIIAIIGISILLDRSPAALLTGLGAFAAALMLIFKDSILGFVSGLQLSLNDMVRVGDWIAVPGTIADGIVTDVSLTTVKIRNWDNTTVTLPPYTLVSTPFQNWNKMRDRGRRQINRSIIIDVTTVCPTTPEMLESLKKLPYMKDYIEKMQQFAAENKATCLMRDGIEVNGSIDTNLGVYRAYCGIYLRHHPYVALGPGTFCMVRLQQQTESGIPLNVFCYTNTVNWVAYEGIQSDIFEHMMAIAPAFGLSAFSLPTGRDVVNIANPKPQAMPYNGNSPVQTNTYDPTTNFMVPPNISGDEGVEYSDKPIYPDLINEATKAAQEQGIPTVTPEDGVKPPIIKIF